MFSRTSVVRITRVGGVVKLNRYFGRALELTPAESAREHYELLLSRETVYDRQGDRGAQ